MSPTLAARSTITYQPRSPASLDRRQDRSGTRGDTLACRLLVRQACCESWRWKSSAGRDDRNREPKARVSVASRNLKEAGGETRTRRTGIGYKAAAAGSPGHGRGSPMVIRTRAAVDPAGLGGKSHNLPWEVSRPVRANRAIVSATMREGTGEVSRGRSRSCRR